ncbi:hypothetical protein Tco_0526952 [Tanacetum coccineum]
MTTSLYRKLSEANYIIDTLVERLFERYNQAYILKFDRQSTPLSDSGYGSTRKSTAKLIESVQTPSKNMVIYEGNESCKVYIISFLAAIPIRELVADMKRGSCSSKPLCHRLQIEFHCTQLHPPPPPAAANPDHRSGRDHAPVPTPVPVPDNAISAPPVGKSAIQVAA